MIHNNKTQPANRPRISHTSVVGNRGRLGLPRAIAARVYALPVPPGVSPFA